MAESVDIISQHILSYLDQLKHKKRPLFVAVQGPQGSGKSYTTDLVKSRLTSSPHNLNVAVFSLDDLYLPHSGLVELAQSHPQNPLWKGRGQPGTHDITLGLQILNALSQDDHPVELPRFDKSLFDGDGDRLPMDGSGPTVQPPVDVVILEGWFTGFYPISTEELESRWEGFWKDERLKLGLGEEEYGRKADIAAVNEKLKEYIPLWQFFPVFIQLSPDNPLDSSASQYSIVYKWRLQQEHTMKARNGGKGMADEAVTLFVNRYIPGYVFFGDGAVKGSGPDKLPPWLGHGLRLVLGPQRQVVRVEHF